MKRWEQRVYPLGTWSFRVRLGENLARTRALPPPAPSRHRSPGLGLGAGPFDQAGTRIERSKLNNCDGFLQRVYIF